MRLNKLLILLLALPLAFASCDKNVETKKDPILTLTSNDVLTFDAESGKGEITYTLKNAAKGTELTATCDAEWITDLTASDKVTFTVMANEDEARETKIVVAYGSQKFEVKVRQNEVDNTINNDDAIRLDNAERYSSDEWDMPDNYFIIMLYDNAYYNQFGIVLIGQEGENILAAGTYTGENGGVMMEGCELYINEIEEHYFDGGEVKIVVEGDVEGYSLDILATDNKGNSFHYVFDGKVKGMDPNGYDVMLDIEKVYSFNREASESGAYHYYLILSDRGITDDNKTIQGSFYYLIDLYCETEGVTDAEGYITLPNGVYTLSTSKQAGTISNAKFAPSNHMSLSEAVPFDMGTLTISDEGVTIDAKVGSNKHLSTFKGAPRFDNRSI